MSVLDKFLDAMRLNDDDYEFENDEYEMEEEYEEDRPSRAELRKQQREARKAERAQEQQQQPKPPARERRAAEEPSSSSSFTNKITPINRKKQSQQGQQTSMEVCVIKPTTIEDELEIADTLLEGRTVVLNMEGLNVEVAQRIIDFTSGSTYAMRGSLQKISNYIFLATPNGVDISGDIQNLVDSFDIPGFTV